ncbi:AMP-binding protein [Bacillota bacterium]
MKCNINEKSFHKIEEITSLKHMLKLSAGKYADRPAFLIKKERGGDYEQIKYAQLSRDVDALGTALMNMGLADLKIAIIGENCYEWIASYLTVVNGVGTVVPLDKELNKEEIHNLLEISQCDGVFFTDTYEEFFKEFPVRHKIRMKVYGDRTDINERLTEEAPVDGIVNWTSLVAAGEAAIGQGNEGYTSRDPDPEKMNMLLFSSGTTGTAKGIMLSHKNIVSCIMDTCKIAGIYPEDRTLSLLPIHHTFENTMGMLLVLSRGASAAFCEGLKYVTRNFVEAKATVLIGVPLIFESIYNKIWKQAEKNNLSGALKKAIKLSHFLKAMGISAERKLFKTIHESFGGNLRMIVCGAAAVDPNVCRGFEDFGITFLQGYGLTECAPLVTGTPDFCDRRKKAGSVGPVVASGELDIINPDDDGIGEVIFKGPNVMLGYYNMPEETSAVLQDDGWFHTGDLGFVDKDGWLYLTGRKKNVIVTKTGKNIYPEEIEIYVNRNKYIHESLVHGVDEDEEAGTIVGIQIHPAYDVIYEEFGAEYDDANIYKLIKEVIKDINEKLPVYKRIRNISIRKDEFLKTTTKKIKRFKHEAK